ncbi:MAG: hypothetical protein KatS3mg057_0045 [Herpetosiphonaceae bacterium]|nr:MAG: hypothetical protein KatS3mg057_0045 [Herpetosiphonaceae bacterium]
MSDIAKRIASLPPEKRARLEAMLQANLAAQRSERAADQIPRYERKDGLAPLSLAQQRLWVIEQLAPGSPLYTIPFVARLHGRLDEAALRATLDALVARHEALRTTIVLREGEPYQLIAPPHPLPLRVVDLRGLPEARRAALAEALVTTAVQTPFLLTGEPLFRAALVRESATQQRLVLTVHHLVCDGWSWGVFIREFAQLYRGYATGQPVRLPELPIQYADYAIWQRARLAGAELERQLAYWRAQLAGAPALLELPTDFARPAAPTLVGATVRATLPAALAEQLRALSQRVGNSLYMTLLAGFAGLLGRYSRQDEVVVGTPVAGRLRAELEGLVGFFVNTLALRLRGVQTRRVRELLAHTREVVLDGFAHQEVPFEQVVEAVAPERALSHAPLVQVMFTLQTEALQRHVTEGMELEPEAVGTATAKFDLTLTAVEELDGRISLVAEYRTDLFAAATIARLLEHYARLLAGMVADEQQRMAEIALLSETERRQVLEGWNATQRAYPAQPVHALVAALAARQPAALAVQAGTEQVSYEALVAGAHRLAHLLRARGVRRGDRVGVYLTRSARLVEVLLGVLAAGAAYVPLDVSYPVERLALMAQDAGLALVLSERALAGQLAGLGVRVLVLEELAAALAAQPATAPAVALTLDDLAYVIYTSGSTGRPKGVAVPHRGIVRLVFGNDYTQFDDRRVFLLLAPISFDASTFELWGALLHGATCVLYPERVPNTDDLAAIIQRSGVTTLWLTASLFNLIVDEAAHILMPVKELLTGGEALSPTHIRRAQAALPNTQLINGYGPTETTTFACCYRIPRPFDPGASSVPIGSPIGNTTTYVLDEYMQLVPVGVPGELYIGGDGLAWGYLGRPALTAERFVPDPFGPTPGGRLYRTGDLVRWRAEGQLEFLGRIDQQVKLRGFRIELGEIESALRRQAGVRDAVVVLREDRPGDKRLVAYVTPAPGAQLLVSALREALQRELPVYMLPSAIVPLDALPLTPNGKLDQSALPTPTLVIDEAPLSDAPLSPAEQMLAEIWTQVLGVEHVGRHDNFFALGGDSILAIQAIARANQAGFQLSTRMLFQYQTIAELAEAALPSTTVRYITATQTPVSGEVPLTPIVAWFDQLDLAEPHYFNQALLLESSEPLDPEALQQALDALVVHHDALRLRFRRRPGASPELRIVPELDAPSVVLIEIDRSDTLTNRAAELQASLDLERGPILRLAIIRRGEGHPDALLFVVHHLAVDGLSWRVLLEDLELAYRQARCGESIQLPPKTTDLISWGRALHAHLASPTVAAEMEFWLALASLSVPPLPIDGPGGPNTAESVETVSICLDTAETEALLRSLPAGIDDLLITALAWALRRWTGSATVALALESHGRAELPAVDVSRTVGWFTSLYPVVLTLPDDSLTAALATVSAHLQSLPPLGLSFGLGRYLGDEALRSALAAIPTPEVSFNYLGQFGRGAGASIFRPSSDDPGSGQSPRNRRPFALDVVSVVQGDHLEVHWIFNTHLHRRETIMALAQTFVAACRELIACYPEATTTSRPLPQPVPARRPSLLLPLNRGGSLPPFFCVHPSGGTVFCYRALARHLGPDQPFYGIQAPGFEVGEEPFADLKQMAARYIDEMRLAQPHGPYYIGGWSLGGIVAAEMAQQLRAAGETVALLAIIDVDPDLSRFQRAQARRLIVLSEQISRAEDLSPSQIRSLRLGEQIDYLFDEAATEGKDLDREQFLTILRVFSAHAQARIAYTPRPYDGRMAIFRACNQIVLDQAKYNPFQLRLRRIAGKLRPRPVDPFLGWGRLATGTIEAYDVPGHHMSIMNEPFVLTLAEWLEEALRRAREAIVNETL